MGFGSSGGAGASVLNKLDGTTAPGVGDDALDGYSALSLWFDVVASPAEVYMCADPTAGAAKWVKTTLTIDELGTMALQNANAVDIQGGSWVISILSTINANVDIKCLGDTRLYRHSTTAEIGFRNNVPTLRSATSGPSMCELSVNPTSVGITKALDVTGAASMDNFYRPAVPPTISSTTATVDQVLVDSYNGVIWEVMMYKGAAKKSVRIKAMHDGTAAADAVNTVSTGELETLTLGALGASVAIDLDGAGASQYMRLRGTSTEASVIFDFKRIAY